MDCLTTGQIISLFLLAVFGLFFESVWRTFFTPKSDEDRVKELSESTCPRDQEIFCELLDEDPSLWSHASGDAEWDLWEDLCALARWPRTIVMVPLAWAVRSLRGALRVRVPQSVPQPMNAEL